MYQPASLVSQAFHSWLNDHYSDLIESGDLNATHITEATKAIIALVNKESQWLRLMPKVVEVA
jgi:hypothetical protein